MNVFKKATIATALAATTLVSASPAMAQNYRRGGGDDTAAIAIGAGIVGLAIGAIVASSNNDRNNDFRRNGYQYRDGYYQDRAGNRFDRQGRPFRNDGYYARRGYNNDGYNNRYGTYRGYGY
jgi:hypothetical protein